MVQRLFDAQVHTGAPPKDVSPDVEGLGKKIAEEFFEKYERGLRGDKLRGTVKMHKHLKDRLS